MIRVPSSGLIFAAIALILFICSGPVRAQDNPEGEKTAMQLRVMTFNLKFANERMPNAWSMRRPVLAETIRHEHPDLIGTQEGLFGQLKDIGTDLPEYAWIGLGREGGSKGEFSAIFYRKDRFDPVAYDHFWLSDTPEAVASRTWGNNNVRMVTWARFLDRASGREFYFWNTHFDHEIERARRKSSRLMLDRLRELTPRLPVIVTGDFNALPGSEPYKTLLSSDDDGGLSLYDTWTTATQPVAGNYSTFHNWRGPDTEGRRIDWILASRDWVCDRILVGFHEKDGQWPSDHFPVVSDLRLAPVTLAESQPAKPAS